MLTKARKTASADDLINSPLLFELLKKLSVDTHLSIFDIAPASAGQLDYFSDFLCTLHLPGCADALCQLQSDLLKSEVPYSEQELIAVLRCNIGLKKCPPGGLDMLLLWDTLNYLDESLLPALVRYLIPFMADNARLHAYIYPRREIASRPSRFYFTEEQKIAVVAQTEKNIASPVYSQPRLHTLLSPLITERRVLLPNGMQEYLFVKAAG